jgi:cobalt transporter subunit CbtA
VLLRLLKTGLAAGFLTAIVYTFVQAVTVTPLILEAETYESNGGGHDHAALFPGAAPLILVHGHETLDAAAGPQDDGWAPADGAERLFFTFLANLVMGIGFAWVLVAAMALRGRPVAARSGLLWGLAGFAVFSVAPALGLPPEVPGSAATDLTARQIWWAATAAASAAGLALVVFSPRRTLQALGIALLLAPHVIGAPHPPAGEAGIVPPELASHFVVWTLATAALFWAVLGTACGDLYRRFA